MLTLTTFFSIFILMSLASVKKASSTLMDALAEVSTNLMPYSMANCSPLSLETCSHENIYIKKSITNILYKYVFNTHEKKLQMIVIGGIRYHSHQILNL